MNWPKKIVVLGVEWRVVYHNNVDDVDPDSNETSYGTTLFKKFEVHIWNAPNENYRMWILWHEILEIAKEYMGIKLSHPDLDRLAALISQISRQVV